MRMKFFVQKYLCVAVLLLFFIVPAEGANPSVPGVHPVTGQLLLDLNVAYHLPPEKVGDNRKAQLIEVFRYLADALYEASNSKYLLRNVNIYLGRDSGANINWNEEGRACATVNGYSTRKGSIEMYDGGYSNGTPYWCVNDDNPTSDNRKWWNTRSAYTLAHELGHYLFGLFDEYEEKNGKWKQPHMPRDGDITPMGFSIMNSPSAALQNNSYAPLNFSTRLNYIGQPENKNAQRRIFNASAWETLIAPPRETPNYPYTQRVQYFDPAKDSALIPKSQNGDLRPMSDCIIDLEYYPKDYKHTSNAQAALEVNFHESDQASNTMRIVVNNSDPQDAQIGGMAAARLLDSARGGSFDIIAFNTEGKPELIASGAVNTSADRDALRTKLQSAIVKPVYVSVNIDDAVAFANPDAYNVVVVSGTLPSNRDIYVISTNNTPPPESEKYIKYYPVFSKEESDLGAIFGSAFDIAHDVYYETDEVFCDELLVKPNGNDNISFRADEAKNGMRIFIGFEGVSADLAIKLTDPDGVVVREDEFYSYESDGMFCRELDSEAFSGSWKIDAVNNLAAEKLVFVSVSALISDDDDAQSRYSLEVASSRGANTAAVAIDEPEVIQVMLYQDNDLLAGAGEIEGAVFDGTESKKIIFRDNGNSENGDSEVDDGIYSAMVKFKRGTHSISANVKLDDATLRVSTINNLYALPPDDDPDPARPPLFGEEFKVSFSRTGMMTVIADKTVAPIERKSSGCNAGNFTPFALILLLFLSKKFNKFKQ